MNNNIFQRWKNDGHGIVFPCKEVKLYWDGSHTWAMKLSAPALRKGKTPIRIATYSLPELDYCYDRLRHAPSRISLVCHDKFVTSALALKNALPELSLYIHSKIHSKIILIAPQTIYLGSANFGVSHWIESNVGIRSRMAHDCCIKNFWKPLISASTKVELYMQYQTG